MTTTAPADQFSPALLQHLEQTASPGLSPQQKMLYALVTRTLLSFQHGLRSNHGLWVPCACSSTSSSSAPSPAAR